MPDTVREVMHEGAECIGEHQSVLDAAHKLADLHVGALPICGDDDRLCGMITDRDIVVSVIAAGRDPAQTPVSELADGKPITIGADDSLELAMQTMADHGVRRLPVIDGHRLVGIISQGDLAQAAPDQVGEPLAVISRSPDNSEQPVSASS